MHTQSSEDHASKNQDQDGNNPKIQSNLRLFPKPDSADHGVTITTDNVIHGIQFDDLQYKRRKADCIDIPHDRCCPDQNLKDNIDDLGQIPEENNNGTCRIDQSCCKYNYAKGIIDDLQHVNAGKSSIKQIEDQHKGNKKEMYEKIRNHLDHRKGADLKYNLFYQIAVFYQYIRPAGQDILKIKPRNQSCDQPKYKGYRYTGFGRLCSGI